MFQESVYTPEQLADLPNRHGYLIARLRVADLEEIGLSVVPTGGDGHVSIPQLSYSASKTDPQSVDRLKKELAKLAAKHVVHRSSPKAP